MTKLLFFRKFTAIQKRVLRILIAMPLLGVLSFLLLLLGRLIPESATALSNGLTAIFFALVLTFALLLCLCELRLCLVYYRTFLGDESAFYLTLPATLDEQITSSLASGIVWQLILLVTGAVTVSLGMLLPFEILLRTENVSYLSYVVRSLTDAFTPLAPLALLLTPTALLILVYTAITLGTLLFERKRALGLILSLFLAVLVALLAYTAADLVAEAFSLEALAHLPSLLVSAALSVAGVFAIRKAVGKRVYST